MSQATSPTAGFDAVPVAPMPALANIGIVESIDDPKLTESGQYFLSRVSLQGQNGSRNITTNFMFRPEWFTPGFSTRTLTERGPEFVYRSNIAGEDSVSVLKAMVGGTDEALAEFAQVRNEAYAALEPAGRDFTAEEIIALIRQFVVETSPTVAYVLGQRREKIKHEDGTTTTKLFNQYEVRSFEVPTDDTVKRWQARAAKSKGKFLVAFEA